MSHVSHMHESCLTYEWVVSHIWMSHVSHMNESCLTYEWVMSHICMSHVLHMNESRLVYECVMSHIWKTHVTYERVMVVCVIGRASWVCSWLWGWLWGLCMNDYEDKHSCTHLIRTSSCETWLIRTSSLSYVMMTCHTHEWVVCHVW